MNATKVIFRKWKSTGDIIALFPEEPADVNGLYCMSYEHIGQHGSASPDLSHCTDKATERDYSELKRELESIGYVLDVKSRITQAMHNKRRLAVR